MYRQFVKLVFHSLELLAKHCDISLVALETDVQFAVEPGRIASTLPQLPELVVAQAHHSVASTYLLFVARLSI